eukprot:375668-Amorphochlora_amoeboformis.AAC.2
MQKERRQGNSRAKAFRVDTADRNLEELVDPMATERDRGGTRINDVTGKRDGRYTCARNPGNSTGIPDESPWEPLFWRRKLPLK